MIGFNSYRFDFVYLLPHILDRWGTDTVLIGSTTDIKFLSSLNVKWDDLRSLMGNCGSLKEAAKVFSSETLQKGDLDFTKIKTLQDVAASEDEIKKYLYNDVALLAVIHQNYFK